jgi:hypothetical protein
MFLRRGLGSLQESLSANLALDAHGFLVLELSLATGSLKIKVQVVWKRTYALGLGLGGLLVLCVALTLHVGLGSLIVDDRQPAIDKEYTQSSPKSRMANGILHCPFLRY